MASFASLLLWSDEKFFFVTLPSIASSTPRADKMKKGVVKIREMAV